VRDLPSHLALSASASVALLAAALLISILAERVRIPAAVLLVGAGIFVGSLWHVRPPFAFSQSLLVIFLPPLIFEAAWNIKLDMLRRTWVPIVLLALPGTIAVAFSIAFGLSLLGSLPFAAALLYGSMVAASDPVAVVAVFRKVPVPEYLTTIVEAESLSNDGVAVVLYTVALAMATGGGIDVPASVLHGALQIAGGVAIGTALACVASWLLRMTASADFEVTMTFALAYGAYLTANGLSLSGIFAAAAAGVVLRALQKKKNGTISNVDSVDAFWNATAFIANAIVFVSTGLLIDFPRIINDPVMIAIAIAIVLASRAILVVLVLRRRRERITAFLSGMRGALPLALALTLPDQIADRSQIIDAVFATVFVTLVLQGLPLESVIRRLYPPNDASQPTG
jgi:CPA1 family monovalent cation:H+ antiporter